MYKADKKTGKFVKVETPKSENLSDTAALEAKIAELEAKLKDATEDRATLEAKIAELEAVSTESGKKTDK